MTVNFPAGGDAAPAPTRAEFGDPRPVSIVGYDGEAYLVDLQPHDAIDVLLPDRVTHCHADFDYRARPGDIPDIGPLPCQ